MGEVLEVGVLGPFEVRVDGAEPLVLGGLRQRALLAVLALHANEVVSKDRLVDELWGEPAPRRAVHTVEVFVSRLRGALGGAGQRLLTRPPGYMLSVGVDELDADRCERLYRKARAALEAGNAKEGVALLERALAVWRGSPLDDFAYEPFAQAAIARLEELRLGCREEFIEAQLALGRHAELVSDLEALVREEPLRERPRGQLMLALYRCGRQAEALGAYQQARRTLVEELGVEPGDALRELEQLILRQDASLQPPAAEPAASSGAGLVLAGQAEGAGSHVEDAPAFVTMMRRTASVLALRLATRGRADPEKARRLAAQARREFELIVARHGGISVPGVGGDMVGVFGIPQTKEDDALRALRAADDLRSQITSGPGHQPGELVPRLGLDTGEVVAEGPTDVFGDPVGGALILAARAGEAEILVSEATRRLASDAVRVEAAAGGAAWRLLDVVSRRSGAHVRLSTRMIGREEDLAYACATFREATRDGGARLLTVVGEAGIGKSRLAKELTDRLQEEATILSGRCLSYGDGVTYWPLREAITAAADGDSTEAIRELLAEEAQDSVIPDVIAAALGLTSGEATSEQVHGAFRRLLEQLAGRQPVLLVIEDVHWAEPALLDLVEYLVDWLTAPLLVLCLTRPELLDVRPRWGGGHPRMSSRVLAPLGDDDAGRLLDEQLGERRLSAAERARILLTAEGNPLFVEQLLASSAEDPEWNHGDQVPATIQALLAARLDRLDAAERAYIERAAIIGREFWQGAVVELLPDDVRSSAAQQLSALVRRGLIHPDKSILAAEEQLRFHHILICDVAYRSTPKALRSDLHEQFADWLGRRVEPYDEFIGYHLERAFRYRTELGEPDDGVRKLGARAGDRLAIAGRRALGRGDTTAAAKLLHTAADLFEAAGDARPDVLLDLGNALSESGDFPEAERVLRQALKQAQGLNDEAVGARARIELSYWRSHVDRRSSSQEMQTIAEEAIGVFDRIGDNAGLSRAWLHHALAHWIRSDARAMEGALERALTHAERAGELGDRSRILIDLARTTVIGPQPVDQAIRRAQAILARSAGDVAASAFAEAMLAVLEAMAGHFDDARTRWQRSKRRLAEAGLNLSVAIIQMYYAFIELLADSPERAEPEVADACEVFDRIGSRGHLSSAAALSARLLYAEGRYDECRRYCRMSDEAMADDDAFSQVVWRGTCAKLLARSGEAADAEETASSAVAIAGATDFLMMHGDALADRAEVMAILDRPECALLDLEQAIELYDRKGMRVTADAARRRSLLLLPQRAG